jgi:hypothetical protein
MSDKVTATAFPNLPHRNIAAGISLATRATWSLSTTSSTVAIPLSLTATTEIDLFEAYLNSGASTAFRCRIVTSSATTKLPTATLAHANADLSITATSAAWNQFNFTNFSLSAGFYWILLDSTVTPSVTLAMLYNVDYFSSAVESVDNSPLYWTGSAWATDATRRSLVVRLKSSVRWMALYPAAPLSGATGLNPLIMDTLENPACRGIRFVAPASGDISGFEISFAGFTASTSCDFVLASEGCSSELARAEISRDQITSADGTLRISFPSATVVAGTSYDFYAIAGSQATTTGGISITAIDTSEDSGNVIGCYGVTPGDIKGLFVHDPPTEGGSDVPTVTLDHIFPWSPVYSEITASGGGGGGETAHVFAS